MRQIVEKVTKTLIEDTIDIPRILVVPKGQSVIGFNQFTLDFSSIRFQPVDRDLLIQHLRTHAQESLIFFEKESDAERLEDILVSGLINFEDISYDHHADLLYDLSGQMVKHFQSYLKNENEIRNVILYHQKNLVNLIHAQMLAHQFENATEYEVIISKGFTELKSTAFTAFGNSDAIDFRSPQFDKKKIGQLIFSGFSKCLYPQTKFGSDTERRFSVILERESDKWFRPAKGQFQIFYLSGNDQKEYIPDFVAECVKTIYMIETKARNEMNSEEVLKKKEAAGKWCLLASKHNLKLDGKPWKYLLIAHDEVQDNMTLKYFENKL
jgi:type III restriction enzyme